MNKLAKLIFSDSGPQLANIVKDHPNWTFIAEAIRNCLEAIVAYKGKGDIYIRKMGIASGLIGYVNEEGDEINYFKNKLSFLNAGGMTAKELETAFTKLGESPGKQNSIWKNFGQGIRTSVLDWSDLLCITYKDGKGHYVWLGKEFVNPRDFQISIKSQWDGGLVRECTDWVKENAKDREYNLEEDFTEVIILGENAHPTQDTFMDPMNTGKTSVPKPAVGNDQWSSNWIQKHIWTRFWKLPEGVKIQLHGSVRSKADTKDSKKGYQEMMTYLECLNYDHPENLNKPQMESVATKDGTIIHYIYDPMLTEGKADGTEWSSPDNVYTQHKSDNLGVGGTSVTSIVLRNEMYDVKAHGSSLSSFYYKLGIQENQKTFKIIYELPDNGDYTFDMYRTYIQNTKTRNGVFLDDPEVIDDIVFWAPNWYRELIKKAKKDSKNSKTLKDRINQRLQKLMEFQDRFKAGTKTTIGGKDKKDKKDHQGGSHDYPKDRKQRILKPKVKFNPDLIEWLPDDEATKPFFIKVEGTLEDRIILFNTKWKYIEKATESLSEGDFGGQYKNEIKSFFEENFIIETAVRYYQVTNEKLNDNIDEREYQNQLSQLSFDIHLKTQGESVLNLVRNELKLLIAENEKQSIAEDRAKLLAKRQGKVNTDLLQGSTSDELAKTKAIMEVEGKLSTPKETA